MERRAWSQTIAAILKNEGRRSPAEVVARYDRLIDQLRRSGHDHAGDWELAEALHLRALYLEECGRFRAALNGYLAVAELHKGYLLSHGHALASALEAAVSAAIHAKQRKNALTLAQQVIKLRGEYPDAAQLGDVVRLLQEEQKRQNERARRQQVRRGLKLGARARRRTRG